MAACSVAPSGQHLGFRLAQCRAKATVLGPRRYSLQKAHGFVSQGDLLVSIDQDLKKIALQEKRLRFKKFDSEVAWTIAAALKTAAEKRQVAVAIEIQLNGHTLFSYAMAGMTPDNWDWIRRKRNVVQRYHRSSYAVGLKNERDRTTLQEKAGLDEKDYAAHGGCFPIFLEGSGCVGTITVSGLPQREDHALVVAVLQDYLGVAGEDLELEAHAGS
jgi:uncharacterized protein (UPF0303 family)